MTAVSEAEKTTSVPPVDEVTLTIENHVATVVIDRQHVLNAVDGRAQARLNEIWDQLEADPDVRAVVITGAGTRAFCVGRGHVRLRRGQDRPASTGPASIRTASAGSACAPRWTCR